MMSEPTQHIEPGSVFVLMPFGTKFDDIYVRLVKNVLEDMGFLVERADDVQSANNIVHTIVRKIDSSQLIVADLTDSNPNVYWELGIAHRSFKPVILLAQNLDTLPFDLRNDRVIVYTRDFTDMESAQEHLQATARSFLSGSEAFGHSVATALGQDIERVTQDNRESSDALEDIEPGYLDLLVDFSDGIDTLTTSMEMFGPRTSEVSQVMININSDLATLKKTQMSPARQIRDQQVLVSRLAEELRQYSEFLKDRNTEFHTAVSVAKPALDGLLSAFTRESGDAGGQIQPEDIEPLNTTFATMVQFRAAIARTRKTIRQVPNASRSLTRANQQIENELKDLDQNVAALEDMLSKAIAAVRIVDKNNSNEGDAVS